MASAKLLLEEGDYDSSTSRIYYSMYYMVKSLLITKNIKARSHPGVVNKFSEVFIKTNIFPKQVGRNFSNALDKRLIGDYGVFQELNKTDTENFLKMGVDFVNLLEDYLKKNGFIS